MVGRKRNAYTFQVSKEFFDEKFDIHPAVFLTFPSFEHYLKVADIEDLMDDLYNIKGIREDEEEFCNHLEKKRKYSQRLGINGT